MNKGRFCNPEDVIIKGRLMLTHGPGDFAIAQPTQVVNSQI